MPSSADPPPEGPLAPSPSRTNERRTPSSGATFDFGNWVAHAPSLHHSEKMFQAGKKRALD